MLDWLKKSVALKVAALSTFVIALVAVGNGTLWYATTAVTARKIDVSRALRTASTLETLVSAKLVEHSSKRGHVYNFLTEVQAQNPEILGVEVHDRRGTMKVHLGKPPTSAPVMVVRQLTFRSACTGCHDSSKAAIGRLTLGFHAPESSRVSHWTLNLMAGSIALLLVSFVIIAWAVHRFLARPLGELSNTVEAAEDGFFLTRAKVERKDEIGRLAQHFNTLLEKITDLKVNIIDTDRELEWAQQELALKRELESKNQIIQSTNQELERTLQELRVLFEITQTLNSTIELDQVLVKMSTQITQSLEIKEFAVFLMDEATARLQLKATYGFFEDESDKQPKYRSLRELSQTVVDSGESIRIEDTSRDPRFELTRYGSELPGSLLCLPVVFMQRCIGTLCFFRPRPRSFDDEEVTLLRSIANQAAMAIGNAQMYHRTKELSIHDELTSIYNRRFLRNRLEMEWSRSKRFDHPLSVLLMDIDHFKQLNDTHGHLYGDQVLKQVAKVLLRSVRRVDTVARYGGEEFVVVLPKTKKAKAVEVAKKLRRAIEQTRFPNLSPEAEGPRVTISVGVSTFPDDAQTTEELIEKADQGLYRAKAAGRNQVVSA